MTDSSESPQLLSHFGELERLASLREKGIISEQEFDTKKRQLLGLDDFSTSTPVAPPNAVLSQREATTKWQYLHVWVQGSNVESSGGFMGAGKKSQPSPYPYQEIQTKLDNLGVEGWELVGMEPHWHWERVGVSLAVEITHPIAIRGYYCTLKRPI